jgi:hypothetical protein
MQKQIRAEVVAPQHNQEQRRSSKSRLPLQKLPLLKKKRLLRRKIRW